MAESKQLLAIGDETGHPLFRPHGRLEIWFEAPFVRVVATGPFNHELLAEYAQRIGPVYRTAAAHGAYVSVVTGRVSIMMPPEAIDALAVSVRRIHEEGYGSKAVAYVATSDVEGRDLVMARLARDVYAPAGVPFAYFDDETAALVWGRRILAAES